MLLCIGGRGWYQEEGKEAMELVPGTVVNIPANIKNTGMGPQRTVGSAILRLKFAVKRLLTNGANRYRMKSTVN